MKKQLKTYQKKGQVKTGTYKPDAAQKLRYALAKYDPTGQLKAKDLRRTDSLMDDAEMRRLRKKLGYDEKKLGGSTMKKYQTKGAVNEPKKPNPYALEVAKKKRVGDMANKMNPSIRDTSTTTRKGLIFKKKGGMVKSMKKK